MSNTGVEYSIEAEINRQTDEQESGFLLYGTVEKEADLNILMFFDVLTTHNVNINDNITDNWLENNTVVNDSIAQNPIEITLSGISGELVYEPSINEGWLKSLYSKINDDFLGRYSSEYVITDKLTIIPELFPPVDNITQTAKNVITTVENNVKRYSKIIDNFFNKKDDKTRLQKIYENLISIRDKCKYSGEGLYVLTPYTSFDNMFIKSIQLTQDNNNHITDISITLKQVNFSDIEYSEADENVLAELNAQMRAQEENKGKVQGRSGDSVLGQWGYSLIGKNVSEL